MKNLIRVDLDNQVATCRVCGAEHTLSRFLMRDQHKLLEHIDELREDHRECNRTPADPRMAKLNREFHKRVERENERLNVGKLTYTPFPLRTAA